MKRWNIYEKREGYGQAFLRGQVKALDAEAAVMEALRKWGVGHYTPYEVGKHGTSGNDKEAVAASQAHL